MESHKFVIRFDRTFDFVPMEDASSTERRDDHPEGCISTEERRDDEQRETTTTTQRRKRGGRTRGRSSLVCLSSTCGYHREEAGCLFLQPPSFTITCERRRQQSLPGCFLRLEPSSRRLLLGLLDVMPGDID